jgi:5-dehydro-2-deoxygluconokinase
MSVIEFDGSREFDAVPLGRVAIDFNPVDMFRTLAQSTTYKKYLGGSPANIAVGLARLGKKVGFLGKVSDDRFGEYAVDYFKKEGIDTSHIFTAKNGESLGLTFTEILSEQESSILMYRNAAADLSLDMTEIDEGYIKNAKILVVSGTALAQSPSREAAYKAIDLAKRNGTVVVFDIDYRAYTWKSREEMAIYYSVAGRESDMIIGSKEEFDLMQGLEGRCLSDGETAAKWFGYGNRIIIVKHGKQGSFVYTADGGKYKALPLPIKKLKSFGGGDAYASAFLYGLLEGWDVLDALKFGNASASLLVASHSCSDAMPDAAQITEYIEKCRAEYGEMVTKE